MAGLVLGLNPQPLEAGADRAENALRGVKREASAVDAAVAKTGAATGRLGGAMGNVGGTLGRFKSQFQQVGYQVGDFAVQVGAGTSAVQALGQQLPQLLGGFGAIGAVMGAVVAIGIPLAAALFNSAGGAKDLGTATTEAADAIDTFREAVANANISTEELKAKFGETAGEIKRAYDLIASLKAEEAQRGIDGLTASLAALYGSGSGGEARSGVADFFDANIYMAFTAAGKEAMAQARQLTAEFVNQQAALANSNGDLDAQLAILTAMLQTVNALAQADGSVSEAEQKLITQIQTALGLVTDQVSLTQELAGEAYRTSDAYADAQMRLAQVGATTETLKQAALEAADAVAAIGRNAPVGGWLSGAISDAGILGAALWDAARAKAALAIADPNAGPDFEGKGKGGSRAPTMVAPLSLDQVISKYATKGGGGGSGGGESAVDKATKAYKALQAAMDPAEKTAQEFAKAQATINEALKLGVISADEAAKAMELAREKYAQAGSMWQEFQTAGGNALDALIDGTLNLKDALKEMIKELILAIAKKRLLASVGGSASDSVGSLIFRGLTGGFAGLFDAGGTIGMGQYGIVGENGPEVVRSTSSGAVVTSRVDTARQMGGGTVRVVVENGDLTMHDDGTISHRIRVMGQQAAGAAVQQVKGSLSGWSQQMRTDGVVT